MPDAEHHFCLVFDFRRSCYVWVARHRLGLVARGQFVTQCDRQPDLDGHCPTVYHDVYTNLLVEGIRFVSPEPIRRMSLVQRARLARVEHFGANGASL